VANLFVVDGEPLHKGIVFVRAIYFSIETMTTLGFGDVLCRVIADLRQQFGVLFSKSFLQPGKP
jgi:voltage-gated potassium channel Kch